MLASFHATAQRWPAIAAEGTRDALLGRWDATFAQLTPFHGGPLDSGAAAEVMSRTHDFLAGREPLFAERVEHGYIVDGHGDLIADDIFCLPDGPRALDCLEFDDRVRYLDTIDDAAFLAMDLEHLGALGQARAFLDWYMEFSGDPAPTALRHHYLAYRAFVRAKVGCLRHAQGDPAAAADVGAYTDLTLRHLRAGAVRLILVAGIPATGKTTLAGRLADQIGAVTLDSDRIRKELAGLPPDQSSAAAYRHGIYTTEWTERTYRELLERAGLLLERGETVVLDASWTAPRHRDAARAGRAHPQRTARASLHRDRHDDRPALGPPHRRILRCGRGHRRRHVRRRAAVARGTGRRHRPGFRHLRVPGARAHRRTHSRDPDGNRFHHRSRTCDVFPRGSQEVGDMRVDRPQWTTKQEAVP
jgi:hypothetical protein